MKTIVWWKHIFTNCFNKQNILYRLIPKIILKFSSVLDSFFSLYFKNSFFRCLSFLNLLSVCSHTARVNILSYIMLRVSLSRHISNFNCSFVNHGSLLVLWQVMQFDMQWKWNVCRVRCLLNISCRREAETAQRGLGTVWSILPLLIWEISPSEKK